MSQSNFKPLMAMILAVVMFSSFPPMLAMSPADNGWLFGAYYSGGQAIGGFAIIKIFYSKYFNMAFASHVWATQKNIEGNSIWDRNLAWWIMIGRFGLPLSGVAVMFSDAAVVSAMSVTTALWVMLLLRYGVESDNLREGRNIRSGKIGWWGGIGTVFGLMMVVASETGNIAISWQWGVIIGVSAAVLDSINFERSIRIAELYVNSNEQIAAMLMVFSACHAVAALISGSVYFVTGGTAEDMPVFAIGFVASLIFQSVGAWLARIATIRTTRAEITLLGGLSIPLGILLVWALSSVGLLDFNIARLDWFWIGTTLAVLSAGLCQIISSK